jgi:HlyD family secretion protein
VSADHLIDERTGLSYYAARVELVDPDLGAKLNGGELYPGMPAEVMIVTGGRTMLDYLLRPIIRSFERAFRES